MSKGAVTRQQIVSHALRRASEVGFEGLTIGALAGELELSKSGLFAHFRSKEQLQIAVLDAAAALFRDEVVRPALKEPRGEPRVRAIFKRWLRWGVAAELPGGCPFVAAAAEFDDRPGPVRDTLVAHQQAWIQTLTRAAAVAVEEGHFRRDLEPGQFAFEMQAVLLAAHFYRRLLHAPAFKRRAEAAFRELVERAH